MPDDQLKTERSLGRQVFDFVWQSAIGAVVAVIVLILLRKYT